MVTATMIVSLGLLIFALRWFGVIQASSNVLVSAQSAISIMRDKSLDDKTREKKLQRASLKMIGLFFSILIRSIISFTIALMPICLLHFSGLVEIEEVIRYLMRWDVISIATVLMVIGIFISKQTTSLTTHAAQVNYSLIDRLLHRIAFSSPSILLTAAHIENRFFSDVYDRIEAKRPIFITSLPRAGTTIMLEMLCCFPSLATHTYRDMPFVLSPLLWSLLSTPFKKRSDLIERAHGDTIKFGYDSPEAFEEIIWRIFWPEKYTENNIAIWNTNDEKEEARVFFLEHLKKIIALRRPYRPQDVRYISKNNGNIARIDLICRMFPDAKILVPVRNPMEHANSLLRQHCNFTKMHKNNSFIRRYMADLGHYEFGELHRPIAFPGVEELSSKWNPLTLEYWLAYWIAAYDHLLARRNKVIITSYERISKEATSELSYICTKLGIPEKGMLERAASLFKEPSLSKVKRVDTDPELLNKAEEIYEILISFKS